MDRRRWSTSTARPTEIPSLHLVTGVNEGRGLVSGQLAGGTRKQLTGAVVDPSTGSTRWSLFNWDLYGFSPDGSMVVGVRISVDEPHDWGIFDADSGEQLHEFEIPAGLRVLRVVWEDDEHLLLLTTQGRQQTILRTTLDGELQQATEAAPYAGGTSPRSAISLRATPLRSIATIRCGSSRLRGVLTQEMGATMTERDADFTAYLQARQGRLLRTAYLLTGDLHQAEDLLQASLAKLYLAWDKVRERDSVDAYVRRIMVNENNSLWRRAWKRRERSTDVLPRAGQCATSTTRGSPARCGTSCRRCPARREPWWCSATTSS